MNLKANTIFITGGGSGIGQALAIELHKLGNQVIISGRRQHALDQTTASNPGMRSILLDIEDPASIQQAAAKLIADFPKLNVLFNNAGIMRLDNLTTSIDESVLTSTINTNLFGPIRMTAALIDHLKQQPAAAVINVSSGLAFIPLAPTAVYCATKAALHSYTQSLRYQLKDTTVKVLELIPPYVATDLLNGASDPRAMPLSDFIAETMSLLATDANEITVDRVKPQRNAAGPNEATFFQQFNDAMAQNPH